MKHLNFGRLGRWVALLCLLALLLCGCGEKGVTVNGTVYPLDTATLDLSGAPIDDPMALTKLTGLTHLDIRNTGITNAQYDALAAALPDCEILWTPLFQGQPYDPGTTDLVIKTLTEQDLADMDRFPNLCYVDATELADCTLLPALLEKYPEIRVDYTVRIGDAVILPDATEAEFCASSAELAAALRLLPQLKTVCLTGTLPEAAELVALQNAYPEVQLLWQVEINGVWTDCTVTELDLSGIPMTDTQELESKLDYLPGLEKVLMMDCGISNEEMEALNLRHEDVLFVWNVTLGPYITVRTDITFFGTHFYGRYVVNDADCENLRYCTEMVCLDLGHQAITKCDFVAYMPHLKYLVLADTGISDLTPLSGLTELVFLEIFMTQVTDYTPLLTVTCLEDLNIGYTYGDIEVVKQMVWLDRLWWSYAAEGMGAQELADFRAAMPDTYIEVWAESSTGGDWRRGQNYYDMRDYMGLPYMYG